jgi:hypothetical protein
MHEALDAGACGQPRRYSCGRPVRPRTRRKVDHDPEGDNRRDNGLARRDARLVQQRRHTRAHFTQRSGARA